MSEKFDVNYLEVGDSFDGGPIEQGYFISAVMAAGGEVEIDGNVVTILQLPKAKAPVAPETVVEVVPEPVVEEAPLVDIAAEEAVIEAPKPPASKPGPKPKPAPAPEAEKE